MSHVGRHLGWRVDLSDQIFKMVHQRIIVTKFGTNWLHSGTCAIPHLSFPTRIPGPKIFLLHSLLKNLEYSDTCHFQHPTPFYGPSVINYT
jgi:hypothetical protein